MATPFARLAKLGPEVAGLFALAVIALLQWSDPAPLQRMRHQVFDFYQTAIPRADTGERVAVVDIDEESIARLGQWPWPRTELAELTRRLGEAGAAAVAYDIVFSEPDRTSPAAIAARYARTGRGESLPDAFARLPSHDALFAESFARVPVVTAFFLEKTRRGRDIEPRASFTWHGSLPVAHVPSYPGALLPLPELEAAATGNGFVTLENDADGIVRRVPLVAIYRGTPYPSLSLEAVRVARGAGSPDLLASDGWNETLSAPGAAVAVRLDGTRIPVTDSGEMWLHFARQGVPDPLPAWRIVDGTMSDAELARAVKDRIVFVGGSATGLQDLVSTPLSASVGGMTVHAAAAEQILAGDFLERPDWAHGVELMLVVLLGGGLALLLPRLGAAKGALATLVAMGATAAGSWLAFTQAHYLLDPTYPMLALAVVYAVQTVAVFYREERQRRYIHAAFDRYLSPELVRQIAADPGKLELGGEERDMSVLMCDIRGFSHISERLGPREVIDFLIQFLTPMSEILLAHRATLDKYIGDAILAFWNAPLDDPEHHAHAARAALEMTAMMAELNRTMPGRAGAVWPGEVRIGIGLNAGLCCVGNMGSRQRLSYSLIGDTVNVAARLEGLTKHYGVPIIVGRALAGQLEGFALLELDRVGLVGRDAPETIYALLGKAPAPFDRLVRAHTTVLRAYRATDWDTAEAALAVAGPEYGAHGLAGLRGLFAQRLAVLRARPPAEGWDGVFQATEK